MAGPTLELIDVSYAQGSVDQKAIANAKAGIFYKAVQGNRIIDSTWSEQRVRADRTAGLPFGVYNYGEPDGTGRKKGKADAAFLFHHATSCGWGREGDLRGVLDIEAYLRNSSYLDAAAYVRGFVSEWKKLMKAAGFNRRSSRPMIYTGSFWRDFMRNPIIVVRCLLWLAAYVGNPGPYKPKAFKRITLWQYGIGRSPGVNGDVDLDRFFGDRKKFDKKMRIKKAKKHSKPHHGGKGHK
jgi:GH25 family lysozyme M1 (1,4-beta-N-acetylmuramidase)